MSNLQSQAQNYYWTDMPLDLSCMFYNKKYLGGLHYCWQLCWEHSNSNKKAPPVQQLIQDLWSMWNSSCLKTECAHHQEAVSEYRKIKEAIDPRFAQQAINHVVLWEPPPMLELFQPSKSFPVINTNTEKAWRIKNIHLPWSYYYFS